MEEDSSKPYKICDVNRDKRKGLVASSLEDLLLKVPDRLALPYENLTIVLELDGTEVDDEEYFATLEPDTTLMVLHGNEKWTANRPLSQISMDQTDDASTEERNQVANLIRGLQHNICHISLLGGTDLELLSDMDPESLVDIIPDKENQNFLEQLKEASGRILLEKRQAEDAMELLKLYHQSVSNGTSSPPAKQERV